MFQQIIILSLLTFSLCQYKELSKHSSVKVEPNTKVYFDLSSFPVGELISFEIEMDLLFGDYSSKQQYKFHIEQVPATSYYDPNYWDLNKLRKVTNKNVSCSGDDCTFTWEEIKEEGKNFIYIYPLAPYKDFTFWGEKIKITHLGDNSVLSAGAIVGIVFGCIFFIVIIILLIACCCCCRNGNTCYTCCYHCCPSCICCCTCCGRSYGPTVPVAPITPVVPPYGAVVQVQQQPVIPPSVPINAYGAVVPPAAYPPTVYPETVYQPGFVPPSY